MTRFRLTTKDPKTLKKTLPELKIKYEDVGREFQSYFFVDLRYTKDAVTGEYEISTKQFDDLCSTLQYYSKVQDKPLYFVNESLEVLRKAKRGVPEIEKGAIIKEDTPIKNIRFGLTKANQ